MGEQGKIAWAAAAGLACLVLGGCVVVLTAALVWVVLEDGEPPAGDFGSTLDMYVDGEIDAGFHDPLPELVRDPLMERRKVLLMHDVNSRTAKDVVARLLHLDAQDSRAAIDLYVSTSGGWQDNAFAIIDVMRNLDAPVNTWAVGGCYSSGTLIVAAGTGRRRAMQNSLLMVHANAAVSELNERYDRMNAERYERAWRLLTDLPEDWYPMLDDSTHYLEPEEALRYGIVDEIVPASDESGSGG